MKKLFCAILALVFILSSCAPLYNSAVDIVVAQFPKGSKGARLQTGLGWQIEFDASEPGWVIGSSAEITALPESQNACGWRDSASKTHFEIQCNTPNKFILQTKGQVQALPLSKPPYLGQVSTYNVKGSQYIHR